MKNSKTLYLKCLFFCLLINNSQAQNTNSDSQEIEVKEITPVRLKEDKKGIFTFILENDKFTGTDRDYTNGIRFSYTTSEKNVYKPIKQASNYLPLLAKNGKKRVTFAFGQSLFTPTDTSKTESLPNDRPYAAWLYSSFGILSDTDKTLDSAVLTLGVVGPSAKGEQTQKYVHDSLNVDQPKGWNNQLHDEPGVVFTYERKWRNVFAISPLGVQIDSIPFAAVNLGNISTNATVGTTLRFGYDLPADYGPPRIRSGLPGSDFFIPNKKINGYLFVTAQATGVARDIFLDGNSFKHSQSVEKRTRVGTLQLGATAIYHDVRISYTHVLSTKEFKGQTQSPQFGAVTLSYRF